MLFWLNWVALGFCCLANGGIGKYLLSKLITYYA